MRSRRKRRRRMKRPIRSPRLKTRSPRKHPAKKQKRNPAKRRARLRSQKRKRRRTARTKGIAVGLIAARSHERNQRKLMERVRREMPLTVVTLGQGVRAKIGKALANAAAKGDDCNPHFGLRMG